MLLADVVEAVEGLEWIGERSTEISCHAIEFFTGEPLGGRLDATLVIGLFQDAADAVARLSGALKGAAAVAVRSALDSAELRRVAAESGIPLLGVGPDLTWGALTHQLHDLLGSTDGSADEATTLSELTALAGERLGNPITVERPSGELLAYSRQGETVDQFRQESVLGRAMPRDLLRSLRLAGVFDTIDASPGAVELDPAQVAGTRRVAVAVRHGGTVIAYVWLLAVDKPYGSDDGRVLTDFARVAARHIVRDDTFRARQRLQRTQLVTELLSGENIDRPGLERRCRASSIDVTTAYTTLVCGVAGVSCESDLVERATRIEGWIRSRDDRAVITTFDECLLVLYPRDHDASALAQLADYCAQQPGETAGPWPVGVSESSGPIGVVGTMFREAADAARVSWAVDHGRRVRYFAELGVYRLLLQVPDASAPISKHVATLREHDSEHGSDLAETLRVYLEAALNGRSAARTLQIHHNSLAHRLQRIEAITGIDLADPDERLAASLDFCRSRLLKSDL